ncbi:hypothetical protein EBQ90_10690 [bacterium]|nr:hypothetical protein [bacterium]
MTLEILVYLIVGIPFVGGVFNLLLPKKRENLVGVCTHFMVGLHLLVTLGAIGFWVMKGAVPWKSHEIKLYSSHNYQFAISFFVDWVTVSFLATLTIICYSITRYALVYLVGDEGYQRFFATLGFFMFGYSLVVLADNFEMLFAGWEFLGITSFLLISFYRYRVRPVKNALKIFTIYRLGDVGLLLGAWLSQLIWHETLNFDRLSEFTSLIHTQLQTQEAIIIGLLIVLSAAAKSAQFPFCFWLPKAMEGPTPSSAIFYGALSIHVGVYVLLRMFPLWGGFWLAKACLFAVGLCTVVLSASATRVQSNIKAQVAYSSLIQVGFMFCEIALGFQTICLLHLISNAFLRGYQLLVSPSVVSYLIRYHNEAPQRQLGGATGKVLKRFPTLAATWYLVSIREGYLENLLEKILWRPMKFTGRATSWLLTNRVLWGLAVLGGIITVLGVSPTWAKSVESTTPFVASMAILLSLASLAERGSAFRAWALLGLTQIFVVASVSVSDHFSARDLLVYLSGNGVCWPLGYFILKALPERELSTFHGYYAESGKKNFFFLICCLGLSGFPISPSYLGEDLILHHATQDRLWLALLIAFCFIISGISALRIYSRLFLGPPKPASRRSV